MIDIKTGGVWPEVALQLAGYRFCDLMLGDRPMIKTDAAFVAQVLPDTVDLVPIKQDESVTAAFLYCAELYESWVRRTDWDHRNDDAYDPVIDSPIYPDEGTNHVVGF